MRAPRGEVGGLYQANKNPEPAGSGLGSGVQSQAGTGQEDAHIAAA